MNFVHKDALLSYDAQYRYWLQRRWTSIPNCWYVLWVLLNPSTADSVIDDHTVRKAAGFSDRWGFKSMQFVNLYAYRSTSPLGLKAVADPAGIDNDRWILDRACGAATIVVAWGQDPVLNSARPAHVLDILKSAHTRPLYCLGTNKNGHPCHPLMLKYETPLQPYEGLLNESRGRTRKGR